MLVKLDIAGDGVTVGGAKHVWKPPRPRFPRLCRCGRRAKPRFYKCALAIVGQRAFFCRPRLRYYLLQHETRSRVLVPNSAEVESEEVRGGRRGQNCRGEGGRSFGQRRTSDCDRSASGGLDSVASPCRQTDLAPPPLPARGRGTRFP